MSNKTIGNILIISAYLILAVTLLERTFRLSEARDQNRELRASLTKLSEQFRTTEILNNCIIENRKLRE